LDLVVEIKEQDLDDALEAEVVSDLDVVFEPLNLDGFVEVLDFIVVKDDVLFEAVSMDFVERMKFEDLNFVGGLCGDSRETADENMIEEHSEGVCSGRAWG